MEKLKTLSIDVFAKLEMIFPTALFDHGVPKFLQQVMQIERWHYLLFLSLPSPGKKASRSCEVGHF